MEQPSLPANVWRLLQNLQPDRMYGIRKQAAEELGKLRISYPPVVSALLAARNSDPSDEVRKLASASLLTSAHQEVLRQHPDLTADFPDLQAIAQIQPEALQTHATSSPSIPDTTQPASSRPPLADSPPAASSTAPLHIPSEFQSLQLLGTIATYLGWGLVGIGGLLVLIGLGSLNQSILGVLSLLPSVGLVALGLFMVIVGQLVACFVAIERNTRATYELLRRQQ